MIYDIFYPKELKAAVADLRARGDLNEEALDEFNYQILIMSIITIGGAISLYIMEVWQVAILFLLLFFLSIVFGGRDYYKRYFASYIMGKRGKAKVQSIKYYVFFSNQIVCIDENNNLPVKIGPILDSVYEKVPKIGDSVEYYQDADKKYKAMPNIMPVKKKYCLSKSIMSGE